LAQAQLLALSGEPADRKLAAEVAGFVHNMPPPDSRRLALARELRAGGDSRTREERKRRRGRRHRDIAS